MKPFTSKHCTQYLTKSSPFNQLRELSEKLRPKDAEIKETIKKREKASLKPDSTVIEKATKELPNEKAKEIGFKPEFKAIGKGVLEEAKLFNNK